MSGASVEAAAGVEAAGAEEAQIECRTCTVLNAADAKKCEVCGNLISRNPNVIVIDSLLDSVLPYVTCEKCTKHNPIHSFSCETCGAILPERSKKERTDQGSCSKEEACTIACPACSFFNQSSSFSCEMCDTRLSRRMPRTSSMKVAEEKMHESGAGWGCAQCKTDNPPKQSVCGGCFSELGDDGEGHGGSAAGAARPKKMQRTHTLSSASSSSAAAAASSSSASVPVQSALNGDGSMLSCPACTYLNSATRLCCELCGTPLQDMVDDDDQLSSSSSPPWDTPTLVGRQKADERDGTSGIIEALMRMRAKNMFTKNPSTIHLVSPMDHYCQRQSDILGHWSCGFRNVQMLFGSMMSHPTYRPHIFGGAGFTPEVQYVQRWIEAAWAAGFDREGAAQLGGRLHGTSTWIGPSEAYALASFFGLRSKVVQINTPQAGKKGKQKEIRAIDATAGQKALGSFVWSYFTTPWESFTIENAVTGEHPSSAASSTSASQDPVSVNTALNGNSSTHTAFRPPLMLQHEGHSRTICGIERKADGSQFLWIFDPASEGSKILSNIQAEVGWQTMVKRGLHTLRSDTYQLLVMLPGRLSDAEREAKKHLEVYILNP